MNREVTPARKPQDPGTVVCPRCLHVQPEGRHFCAQCGAPLTALSTIGPFERIFAMGHMLRSTVSGPVRPIVLLGMWVLLLPPLLVLVWNIKEIDARERWELPLLGVFSAIYCILLYRVTVNFIRQRKMGKDA